MKNPIVKFTIAGQLFSSFSNGGAVRFYNAHHVAVGNAEVEPSGYGVWFDRPDTGVWIDTALEVVTETSVRSRVARALGASKSPEKARAVCANGAKGGRPRKKHEAA